MTVLINGVFQLELWIVKQLTTRNRVQTSSSMTSFVFLFLNLFCLLSTRAWSKQLPAEQGLSGQAIESLTLI